MKKEKNPSQIVQIRVETLKYELSQILNIDPNDIQINIESGITFKGKYDKRTMLSLLCNPTYEMEQKNNSIANSLDPSLYITIITKKGKFSYRLKTEDGDIEKLCFGTLREQKGYEVEVKHTKCKSKDISKIVVGGKLNKFECKFDIKELLENSNPSNTLSEAYIAKAITNYLQRKESFIKEEDLPRKKR